MQIVNAAFSLSARRPQLESQLPAVESLPHQGQRFGPHVLQSVTDALADVWKVPVQRALVHHRAADSRGDGKEPGV